MVQGYILARQLTDVTEPRRYAGELHGAHKVGEQEEGGIVL